VPCLSCVLQQATDSHGRIHRIANPHDALDVSNHSLKLQRSANLLELLPGGTVEADFYFIQSRFYQAPGARLGQQRAIREDLHLGNALLLGIGNALLQRTVEQRFAEVVQVDLGAFVVRALVDYSSKQLIVHVAHGASHPLVGANRASGIAGVGGLDSNHRGERLQAYVECAADDSAGGLGREDVGATHRFFPLRCPET